MLIRRSGFRRALWIGQAVVVLVVAGFGAFAVWALNPSSLKPSLVAAVERATGRELTIAGDMAIKLSLTPTISMEDVSLSNPPGFSRPEMVKVERVELGLALLPLLGHRFEVDHITLVRPDISLETDGTGQPNWVFARGAKKDQSPAAMEAPPATAGSPEIASPKAAGEPARGFAISLKDTSVVDGRIGWIDGKSRHRYVAEGLRLTLTAPNDGSGSGPVDLSGTFTFDGRTIGLTARTVPGDNAAGPWPVALKLQSGGATVTIDGQIARPLEGRGYSLAIDANIPDPSYFTPFFPRYPLASLNGISAEAQISDSGGPIPNISMLRIKVGSIDLGRLAQGTRLEDVTVAARGQSPIKVVARVVSGALTSGISGNAGDLGWLTNGLSGPVVVDLEWNAASARASVKGTIQAPVRLSGIALDVAVNVPNPSLVMNDAPPALRSVIFQTRLTDAPGPVPFKLTSSAGDLTGELAVTRSPRLTVEGQVSSRRLDLDALGRPPAKAPVGAPASGQSAAPAEDTATPLISGAKLPFDVLRRMDANVKFAFAQLRLGGADVNGIGGAVSVKDGQLRLDPFTIAGPDQHLTGLFVADGAKSPPSVHLTIAGAGLPLRSVLAASGLPLAATGMVEIKADLTGEGDSARAIAGSLDGWTGLAVEGGQLDAQMVNSWLERLQPLRIGGADVTELRCLALRADAKAGVVTIQPLALNTSALILEGGGDVDLRQETLSLRLRPRAKIGGTGIALPVRVSGPMRDPSAKIDISANGLSGGLSGLLLGGKDIMGAAGGGDPCPPALARAREDAPASGNAAGGKP